MIKGVIPLVILAAIVYVFWITWAVIKKSNDKED